MIEPREHLLISRVVDGDASDREWAELVTLAEADPMVWRDLAKTQRDHSALTHAMNCAGAIAEATPLADPSPGAKQFHASHRFASWSGWSVAALIAVMALVRGVQPPSSGPGPNPNAHQAGLVNFGSAADAFQAYLDKGAESGEVIGEVPARLLVESRPMAEGKGFEVVFVRQVLERTIVPDLYHVEGQNELGQPTLIRYRGPSDGSM